jgi:hypothetical protein
LPHRIDRRAFIGGLVAGVSGIGAARTTGIPGPFPGRVIEVAHPRAVTAGLRDRSVVRAMLDRGLRELTGTDHAVEAWRSLFRGGDRVGIKLATAGRPLATSSPELLLEVIGGLESAGVRRRDILVFERFRFELLEAKCPGVLPAGVAWATSSDDYDRAQLDIAGYDPDVFCELPFCMPPPDHDPRDARRFRSHVSTIITRRIDKFISIPVLKHHIAAGVTLSLKNLSHGSVNNVARSHVSGQPDRFAAFIPAVVSLPVIRRKAVLQILDGLVGCYDGGPNAGNPSFATWERRALFFATDPVALDRVGWEAVSAERARRGRLPILAPYIEKAAEEGLGVYDRRDKRFEHRRIALA